ncbi:MAG: hypothetical protein JW888_09400 [Pirellulales bacterium]|nr:hypothetical protein [Pirellulales bacterium]
MADGFLGPLLTQLLSHSPMLLVYLLGIVLALAFMRRCPGPSVLTLIAMVLLLATTIGMMSLQMFIIHRARDIDLSIAHIMSIVAVVGVVIRAIAMGLLLAAVFSGRSRPRVAGVQGQNQNQPPLAAEIKPETRPNA